MYETLDLKRLDEYAEGLNSHIRRGEELVEAMRDVKQAIDEFRNARENYYLYEMRQLREDFNMFLKHLEKNGMPGIDVYGHRMEQLGSLVYTDNWPIAIDPDYMALTDEAKQLNAKHILDLLVTEYLDGLKFLDFGCGGGFVAYEAATRSTALSVGYDPKGEWRCEPTDRFLLTDSIEETIKHSPYDLILMHDVLDHCQDPVKALIQARELLSNRGRIYLRNHPWCSKHGGHLYEHVNKAYVHVIFDEVEQMKLFGRSTSFVHKLIHPVSTYHGWFAKAGLEIRSENLIREPAIPDLFTDPYQVNIQERLMKHWKAGDSIHHMNLSFAQYVLEANESHKNVM